MATHQAFLFDLDIDFVKLKTITLSGTVKKSGVGIVRKVLVYKKIKSSTINEADDFDLHAETTSASDGTWSVDVYGGSNDEFRVIAVGLDSENSDIFEHIVEG